MRRPAREEAGPQHDDFHDDDFWEDVMNHMKLKTAGLAILALAMTGAGAMAQDKAGWPSRLTMGTGPVGGTGYTMSSPWASVIGASLGLPISVEATAGFPINTRMVDAGQAEVAMTTTSIAYGAWNGAEFTEGKKLENIRTLIVLDANVLQLYTKPDSGIAGIGDLAGKAIAPSRAKSEADTLVRGILDTLKIEAGRIVNVAPTQANDLLRDGQIDVAGGTGTVPHPAATEFEAGSEARVIGFTDDEVKTYLAANPALSRYDIPANTFKNQKEPVTSVGSYLIIFGSKDIPDTLAYELVKRTFEARDQLANAYKNYGNMDPKEIVRSTIPVHPGAVKYYEEQGIQVPAELKQ